MRILLISDVHANICALEAIERAETWDQVWCCGDLVDFGPFPMETIRWMQSHEVKTVLGNHDAHVLSLSKDDCRRAREEKRWGWAHHNRERLDDDAFTWLGALPKTLLLQADGWQCQVQHQYDSAYGTVESVMQFDDFWKGEEALQRMLLFGHTHRRCVHMLAQDRLWVNPGSVSYRRPDDTDKRAHYMMLEDGKLRFGALSYDRSTLLRETEACRLQGGMIRENLQDAYFFFGDAKTTRDALPGECADCF